MSSRIAPFSPGTYSSWFAMVTLPSLVPFRPWPSHGSRQPGSSIVALRPLQTEFLISGTECVYHCWKHFSDLCGDLILKDRWLAKTSFSVDAKGDFWGHRNPHWSVNKNLSLYRNWKSVVFSSGKLYFDFSCVKIRNILWVTIFLYPNFILNVFLYLPNFDHFILQCRP